MHSEVICCNNRCFLCLKWLFMLPSEEVTYRFDLLSIFYVFILWNTWKYLDKFCFILGELKEKLYKYWVFTATNENWSSVSCTLAKLSEFHCCFPNCYRFLRDSLGKISAHKIFLSFRTYYGMPLLRLSGKELLLHILSTALQNE